MGQHRLKALKEFASAWSKRRYAIDSGPLKYIGDRHSRFVQTDDGKYPSLAKGDASSHDFVPEMGVAIYLDNRKHTKAPVTSFVFFPRQLLHRKD